MELVFRHMPGESNPSPAPGEILLHPAAIEEGGRRGLALLVLDRGPEFPLRGEGPVARIVIQAGPTLDDMLAAAFLIRQLGGEQLPAGARAFARYAALVREGLRPAAIPLEDSLEGVYLAILNASEQDLTDPEAAGRFQADWARLEERIWQAVAEGIDPFATPLFRDRQPFARELAFLARDREVYREDIARGEQWLVRLPGGPPTARGLLLHRPRSLLWKYWSRSGEACPSGRAYLFLGVDQGNGRWVFSTDPVQRLSLKALAEMLQQAETGQDPGRASADPWFDGKPFQHTLIASPRRGSVLSPARVCNIVRHWAGAKPLHRRKLSLRVMVLFASLAACALLAGFLPRLWNGVGPATHTTKPAVPPVAPPIDRPFPPGSPFPTLHLLGVGVSRYRNSTYNLSFADKDALALQDAFQAYQGEGYQHMEAHLLTNEKATKENIMQDLIWLVKNTTQNDMAIVTFAGHGQLDNTTRQFFFLPYDFDPDKTLDTTSISADALLRHLKEVSGLVLLLLDTCHSGGVAPLGFRGMEREDVEVAATRVVRQLEDNPKGIVILAASTERQRARENPRWGHGAMTLALLEGLGGQRLWQEQALSRLPQETDQDGRLSLEDLEHYATKRVKELTNGSQAVVTNKSKGLSLDGIVIGRIKGP